MNIDDLPEESRKDSDLPLEVPVLGFEEFYRVDKYGNVFSLHRTKTITGNNQPKLIKVLNKDFCPTVILSKKVDGKTIRKSCSLRKLVYESFFGKTNKKLTNRDGDRSNCSLENICFKSEPISIDVPDTKAIS